MASLSLGVDLGGTNARAAVVDRDSGAIVASHKESHRSRTPEAVVEAVSEAVRRSLAAAGLGAASFTSVGVGIAAQVLGRTGVVLGDRFLLFATGGLAFGDNIARGYVTIDVVNGCTLDSVNTPSYISNSLSFQNILWGDYFRIDSDQNCADGNPMVHIEASLTDPATTTPGRYTFYGRYTSPAWNASDHREPLDTTFAGRFINGGVFSGGSKYYVWRDSKNNQGAFACGSTPDWYPLGQEAIAIFDEQEHLVTAQTFPVSPQPPNSTVIPFPAEANDTVIGGINLPVPYPFGWLYLNLNYTATLGQGIGKPPFDPASAQAFVEIEMEAQGRFSVGFNAIQLDSACAPNHFSPGGT